MDFVFAARAEWDEFQKHPKIGPILLKNGQKGVVVCIFNAEDKLVLCERVGDLSKSETPQLERLAGAAHTHLALNKKHILSYQSSDLALENIGAALRVAPRVFACAGIPEEIAHLLLIRSAMRTGLITPVVAKKLTGLFPQSYRREVEWEDID